MNRFAYLCVIALVVSTTSAAFSIRVQDAISHDEILEASCSIFNAAGVLLANNATQSGLCYFDYTLESLTSYTLRISATGFYTVDYPYVSTEAPDGSTVSVPLSGHIDSTLMRVIVHWGVGDDVDGRLVILRSDAQWFKSANESDPCKEVFYEADSCWANTTGTPTIVLASDNSGEFAFEATTFSNLPGGEYSYWVRNIETNWTIPAPVVYLYTSAGLLQTFQLPHRTSTDRDWHIFNFAVDQVGNCKSVTVEVSNTMTNGYDLLPSRYPIVSITSISTCTSATADCNTKITGEFKSCAVFGDPHVITFSGEGTTCSARGTTALVDNEWFMVEADNLQLDEEATPTAVKALHLTYKKCNPLTVSITAGQDLPTPGAPAAGAGVHTIRRDGNSLFLDGVNTRIEIQQSGDFLVFAIYTPLIGTTGLCHRCGLGESVNISNPNSTIIESKRSSLAYTPEEAYTLCSNAKLEGFYREACTFDVIITQDDQFVQQAATASTTLRKAQEGIIEPPADGKVGAPIATGSASSIAFSATVVALVVVALVL